MLLKSEFIVIINRIRRIKCFDKWFRTMILWRIFGIISKETHYGEGGRILKTHSTQIQKPL